MENNELNHCSKCRSIILRIRKRLLINLSYYIVCHSCGKIGMFAETEEQAILNWNKKNWGLTNAEKNYWFAKDKET